MNTTVIERLLVTSRIMWQPEVVYNWQWRTMVLRGVVGCSKHSWRDKDVPFCRIPKIIISRGEETRMLTEKRRNRFVAAVSKCDTLATAKFSLRQKIFSTPLVWNACSTVVLSVSRSTWMPFSPAENDIACIHIHVQYRSNECVLSTSSSLHEKHSSPALNV